VERLYGRPDVSVRETSGIGYGSGSEDPPVYPAGSAFRWPGGAVGAAVQPEINSNTPSASSEHVTMLSRAMSAVAVADHALPERSVTLTSQLTLTIAVKFPIARLPNAYHFARRGRPVRQRRDRRLRLAVH